MSKAPINRPTWDDYFMGLAFLVSQRSHDHNTQHGCVIVVENNIPIGMGYNAFPRGMDDSELPNARPKDGDSITGPNSKYSWMIHSEVNAISNCSVNPKLVPGVKTAYITGTPCNNCLMHLWQNGITRLVICKRVGWQLETDESKQIFETFMQHVNREGMLLQLKFVEPKLEWMQYLVSNLNKQGIIKTENNKLQDTFL